MFFIDHSIHAIQYWMINQTFKIRTICTLTTYKKPFSFSSCPTLNHSWYKPSCAIRVCQLFESIFCIFLRFANIFKTYFFSFHRRRKKTFLNKCHSHHFNHLYRFISGYVYAVITCSNTGNVKCCVVSYKRYTKARKRLNDIITRIIDTNNYFYLTRSCFNPYAAGG